jgi:ABC-2 type transport system ATP-binding protein
MAVAGPLDDLRESYRRIQFVFAGEAPQPALRAPGIVRMRRSGRVLTVLSNAGVEPIVDETRALGAVSVDVAPVTLKEIFLETVAPGD